MSTRDRLLSSLSSAHDQVRSAVDHHLTNLQQQYDQHHQQRGSAHNTNQQHYPPPQHPPSDLTRNGTLPPYASRPNPHAPSVPDSVLDAPPGRAQETYDSMPRSRLENPNVPSHERRKAAEEIRRNQEMLHRSNGSSAFDQGQHVHRQNIQNQPPPLSPQEQRERAMGLKRTHTYASGNGKVLVDLFTLPQKSPTFMGGSAERGRGAMTGQIIVFANDGDRVGAVRLKVKAVARASLPRSHYPPGVDPNARSAGPPPSNHPVNLVGRSPKVEPTQSKEHLLLQLEKTLWTPGSRTDQDAQLQLPDGKSDATTWRAGRHVFDFKIDLPAASKDGSELPPSFVFLADPQASPSTVKQAQISSAVSNAKKWINEASQSGVGGEWASIKWYVKVTIEKPGLFRANERVFAPFVYLPPPPAKLNERVIPRRLKLSQELRQDPQTPAQALAEPASDWGEAELDLTGQTHQMQAGKNAKQNKRSSAASSAGGGGGGLWSKIFKGPLVSSGNGTAGGMQWSIHLPNRPAIWPLRAIVPFELKVQGSQVGQPGARPAPPSVGLFLRVTLINGARGLTTGKNAPMSATETRLISVARLFGGTTTNVPSMGASSYTWRGLLDFPPQATPCFDSNLIQVEYFIAVQTMPQQPPMNGPGAQSVRPVGRIAWAQKVVLVCPLPTVVRPPTAIQSSRTSNRNDATPRTRGGVRRVPSAGRRVGKGGNNDTIKASSLAAATSSPGRSPQTTSSNARPPIPPRPSESALTSSPRPSGKSRQTSSTTRDDSPPGPGPGITPVGSASTRPSGSRRGSAASVAAAGVSSSPRARSRRGSPPPGTSAAGSDVSAAPSISSTSHHGHRRGSGSGAAATGSGSRQGPPTTSSAAAATSASGYPLEKAPLSTIPSSAVPDDLSFDSSRRSASASASTSAGTGVPSTSQHARNATTPTASSSRRSSVAPSVNESEWSYEDESQSAQHHPQQQQQQQQQQPTPSSASRGIMDEMEDFDADMQGMGMDLPPSYFEATGMGEREED